MKTRVGVVGLGYWGPNLVRNVLASQQFDLTAVVDLDPARLESVVRPSPAVRAASTMRTVLNDVDAVIIATPPETHAALVREALEAGKHVMVEKPLATDGPTAWGLVDLAEARGLILAVDHTFLYTGSVEYLRGAIERGELGQLYGLHSVRVNLGLYQRFASVYMDLASHDISIFNHLLGERPSHVAAISLRLLNESFSDVAYLTLRYPSGIHGHAHVSWLSPVKVRQLTISGSRKMAMWDDVEPSEKVRIYDKGVDFIGDADARAASFVSYRAGDMHAPSIDTREALAKVIDAFAQAIGEGEPMRCNAQEGAAIVDVFEAVERSIAAGGAFVQVNSGRHAVNPV